ncbi:hypothetical protein OHD49_00750 [Escherichia coli]|nr:hypothetical protein [Escherichia coli]
MWLVHLSPGRLKRDVVVYVPPESPSAENGPQCGGRQAETAAPSGAVALHTVRCAGAPHPARLKKNDSTTMACGGHWRTTPAQVKTEKTARHLQLKSEISSLFHSYLSR